MVSGEVCDSGGGPAWQASPVGLEKTSMESGNSKRARVLSKPDLITLIIVVTIILIMNAITLVLVF